ncbi:hypothetical protein TWF718_006592 [Orbilia javanica]|uniref:C2H2-type domain-containing protein n=1 Tax=Orbilia javanica TaxID=47235 RepID=A0AAN8RHU3_9PEZI
MGRDKPTQSENQVLDVGSDAHLWAFMGSSSADSPPWQQFYDPLLPMDPESLIQMQQQRTIYNNNYPWNGIDLDINTLKAMQELPNLQQPSTWAESDVPSPNSQNYVYSDSRETSPCISTNTASESDAQRINMGDNHSGYRDDFRTLTLPEQQKILAAETDLSRRLQLNEIFMDNVSRITALLDDPGSTRLSVAASKLDAAKPRNGEGLKTQRRLSNDKERSGAAEGDIGVKAPRREIQPSEETGHTCPHCGVACRDKTSLRKHMYVHQPRRYFCAFDGCNIGFHTKRDLRRHTDTKHRKLATGVIGSRIRRKSFICKIDQCERGRAKPFSRRDNARQHVVGVHGIKNTRGEAEKVIEEIDIDIEGDTAPELVEESKPPSTQRAEPNKPPEAPIKPSATDRVPPSSGHKISKPKESEDVLAEFTNLQEERQNASVTKGNSSGQSTKVPQKKPSASEPGDIRPPVDSGVLTPQASQDEQFNFLQQQLMMSSSLLAHAQPDTSGEDLDRALDIWEQLAKAEKNGTAPPIDPSSLFDIEMLSGFANMRI